MTAKEDLQKGLGKANTGAVEELGQQQEGGQLR